YSAEVGTAIVDVQDAYAMQYKAFKRAAAERGRIEMEQKGRLAMASINDETSELADVQLARAKVEKAAAEGLTDEEAKRAAEKRERAGGAAKRMGTDEDTGVKARQLSAKRADMEKLAENVAVTDVHGMKAKVVEVDFADLDADLADAAAAYQFRAADGTLVIALNANAQFTGFREEALFHEAREAFWETSLANNVDMAKLADKEAERLAKEQLKAEGVEVNEAGVARIKEDMMPQVISRMAHIVTSAEQAAQFGKAELGGLTPYHYAELERMAATEADRFAALATEDRSFNRKLMDALTKSSAWSEMTVKFGMAAIRNYEGALKTIPRAMQVFGMNFAEAASLAGYLFATIGGEFAPVTMKYASENISANNTINQIFMNATPQVRFAMIKALGRDPFYISGQKTALLMEEVKDSQGRTTKKGLTQIVAEAEDMARRGEEQEVIGRFMEDEIMRASGNKREIVVEKVAETQADGTVVVNLVAVSRSVEGKEQRIPVGRTSAMTVEEARQEMERPVNVIAVGDVHNDLGSLERIQQYAADNGCLLLYNGDMILELRERGQDRITASGRRVLKMVFNEKESERGLVDALLSVELNEYVTQEAVDNMKWFENELRFEGLEDQAKQVGVFAAKMENALATGNKLAQEDVDALINNLDFMEMRERLAPGVFMSLEQSHSAPKMYPLMQAFESSYPAEFVVAKKDVTGNITGSMVVEHQPGFNIGMEMGIDNVISSGSGAALKRGVSEKAGTVDAVLAQRILDHIGNRDVSIQGHEHPLYINPATKEKIQAPVIVYRTADGTWAWKFVFGQADIDAIGDVNKALILQPETEANVRLVAGTEVDAAGKTKVAFTLAEGFAAADAEVKYEYLSEDILASRQQIQTQKALEARAKAVAAREKASDKKLGQDERSEALNEVQAAEAERKAAEDEMGAMDMTGKNGEAYAQAFMDVYKAQGKLLPLFAQRAVFNSALNPNIGKGVKISMDKIVKVAAARALMVDVTDEMLKDTSLVDAALAQEVGLDQNALANVATSADFLEVLRTAARDQGVIASEVDAASTINQALVLLARANLEIVMKQAMRDMDQESQDEFKKMIEGLPEDQRLWLMENFSTPEKKGMNTFSVSRDQQNRPLSIRISYQDGTENIFEDGYLDTMLVLAGAAKRMGTDEDTGAKARELFRGHNLFVQAARTSGSEEIIEGQKAIVVDFDFGSLGRDVKDAGLAYQFRENNVLYIVRNVNADFKKQVQAAGADYDQALNEAVYHEAREAAWMQNVYLQNKAVELAGKWQEL
ncbi:MAG: hypothetical protein WBD00_03345, partial [Candidatus Omnitrophota bacterium]